MLKRLWRHALTIPKSVCGARPTGRVGAVTMGPGMFAFLGGCLSFWSFTSVFCCEPSSWTDPSVRCIGPSHRSFPTPPGGRVRAAKSIHRLPCGCAENVMPGLSRLWRQGRIHSTSGPVRGPSPSSDTSARRSRPGRLRSDVVRRSASMPTFELICCGHTSAAPMTRRLLVGWASMPR